VFVAVRTGSAVFLDALVITALLGFVGTVTVARFMERRGP
jgi:multisubunit Na+/H+ antiporter MnhF subunit